MTQLKHNSIKPCSFVFDELGSIDGGCHVGIFEHIRDQGTYIYFGHKDKVYVISKQLNVNFFGVCAEGYVEDSKGHVKKSLALQAL
jgi:hypothetical protein